MSTLTLISDVEITSMLMPFSARVRNIVWATPGCVAHADADDGYLGHARIMRHVAIANRRGCLLDRVKRAMEVAAADGESEIGSFAVLRHVLHDHVDVDAGIAPADRKSLRQCPACRECDAA